MEKGLIKRDFRRVLSVALSLLLTFGLLTGGTPLKVRAAWERWMEINEGTSAEVIKGYLSDQADVIAEEDGTVRIVLNSDLVLEKSLHFVSGNYIVDLNGHTLTGPDRAENNLNNPPVRVSGGTVTFSGVRGGSLAGGKGQVSEAAAYCGLEVMGGVVNINSNIVVTGQAALLIQNSGMVNVNHAFTVEGRNCNYNNPNPVPVGVYVGNGGVLNGNGIQFTARGNRAINIDKGGKVTRLNAIATADYNNNVQGHGLYIVGAEVEVVGGIYTGRDRGIYCTRWAGDSCNVSIRDACFIGTRGYGLQLAGEGFNEDNPFTIISGVFQGNTFAVGQSSNQQDAGEHEVPESLLAEGSGAVYEERNGSNWKLTVGSVHTWEWKYDAGEHWQECADCGVQNGDKEAHDRGNYSVIKQPTETETGTMRYQCGKCGYEWEEEIPRLNHTHQYGEWQHDEQNHWHECACGDKQDGGTHQWDKGTVVQEPTETDTGSKKYSCTVCGYERFETLPATGTDPQKGQIRQEVTVEEGAPQTGFAMSTERLAQILLTQEDQRELENGNDITMQLKVSDAGESVSGGDLSADKALVNAALGDYQAGQFIDLQLFKVIGPNQEKITEVTERISITLEIPLELRAAESDPERVYAMARVHNGVVEILEDMDNDRDTITIASDRFSLYAILFRDAAEPDSGIEDDRPNDTGDSKPEERPGTEDSKPEEQPDAGDSKPEEQPGAGDSEPEEQTDRGGSIPEARSGRTGNEPKTGESRAVEFYATTAMIAGGLYLLLYFTPESNGMTEEDKRNLVSGLIGWAKMGGRSRRLLALFAIFWILVYYHSIGKRTATEWNKAS